MGKEYLGLSAMQEGMAYVIEARNAPVGIWVGEVQGVLISRYKIPGKPYSFIEYHWDKEEGWGTAKPLYPVEPFPTKLASTLNCLAPEEAQLVCAWLDRLECEKFGQAAFVERQRGLDGWVMRQARRRRGLDI